MPLAARVTPAPERYANLSMLFASAQSSSTQTSVRPSRARKPDQIAASAASRLLGIREHLQVRVTSDDHGAAGAPDLDERRELVEVLGLQPLVLRGVPGFDVEAVQVDLVTVAEGHGHDPGALHRQAVGRARRQDPTEALRPGQMPLVGQGVAGHHPDAVADEQPASAGVDADRCRARVAVGPVRVGGIGAQAAVVVREVEQRQRRLPPVEVLLGEHDVVGVEQRADARQVGLGVRPRDPLGQAGDVVGQHVELTGRFGQRHQRRGRTTGVRRRRSARPEHGDRRRDQCQERHACPAFSPS